MDRFIVIKQHYANNRAFDFKIQYGQIYSPNARRIVSTSPSFKIQYGQIYRNLKLLTKLNSQSFKIQYGQIYSKNSRARNFLNAVFKIQYGQIYRPKDNSFKWFWETLKSNMDRFIVIQCPFISNIKKL